MTRMQLPCQVWFFFLTPWEFTPMLKITPERNVVFAKEEIKLLKNNPP